MLLSYREIVPSEDTTSEVVLVSFRKNMLYLFEREQCSETHGGFDKRLIKSYLLYGMVIVLHDEVEAEETANPAAKHLNDSHSCMMKYILFGHTRSFLFLLKKAPLREVTIVANVIHFNSIWLACIGEIEDDRVIQGLSVQYKVDRLNDLTVNTLF